MATITNTKNTKNTSNQNGSPTKRPEIKLPDLSFSAAPENVKLSDKGRGADTPPFIVDGVKAAIARMNDANPVMQIPLPSDDAKVANKVILLLQRESKNTPYSIRASYDAKLHTVFYKAIKKVVRTPKDK